MRSAVKSDQAVTPFTLRLPTEVLEEIRELAAAEDRSVNGWIVQTLRKAAAAETEFAR